MAMQDWMDKYPQVKALLQSEGESLEYAPDMVPVEEASCYYWQGNLSTETLSGMREERSLRVLRHDNPVSLARVVEVSPEHQYIVEIRERVMRFWKNGTQLVHSSGAPVEVVTPYQGSELLSLRTVQLSDGLVFWHAAHTPQILRRLNDTQWVLEAMEHWESSQYDVLVQMGVLTGGSCHQFPLLVLDASES